MSPHTTFHPDFLFFEFPVENICGTTTGSVSRYGNAIHYSFTVSESLRFNGENLSRWDVVTDNLVDKVIRHYIPSGEVLSVEAQTFANGEAVMYGVTVTAYASGGRTADIFYGEFEE